MLSWFQRGLRQEYCLFWGLCYALRMCKPKRVYRHSHLVEWLCPLCLEGVTYYLQAMIICWHNLNLDNIEQILSSFNCFLLLRTMKYFSTISLINNQSVIIDMQMVLSEKWNEICHSNPEAFFTFKINELFDIARGYISESITSTTWRFATMILRHITSRISLRAKSDLIIENHIFQHG